MGGRRKRRRKGRSEEGERLPSGAFENSHDLSVQLEGAVSFIVESKTVQHQFKG